MNLGTRRAFPPGCVLLLALGFAGCDNPEPPASCGPVPQVTLHVGESANVRAYFEDPDGDMLTFAATSSDSAVARVSMSGNTVAIMASTPGNVTVSVTATDPGGLEGSLSFRVLVPNRPPEIAEAIPGWVVAVGATASLDVSGFFSEPDGETLTYSATSSDVSVAAVALADSEVTIRAIALGTANVRVAAIDPHGLSTTQTVQVVVKEPERGYRDDFDTPASLERWTLTNATALVSEGILELTGTSSAQVGLAERVLLNPVTSWRIEARLGRMETDDSIVSVWWLTEHARFPVAAFDIGVANRRNYNLYLYDEDNQRWGRVRDMSGDSEAINEGAGDLTVIALRYEPGRLTVTAGTTELFSFEGNELFIEIFGHVASVGLVNEGAIGNTVLFDWIEIDGDPAIPGADAAPAMLREPRSSPPYAWIGATSSVRTEVTAFPPGLFGLRIASSTTR